MLGVIDVGGGMRDIFGAAIFDYCMDHQIQFDYGIGVSAGSANVMAYITGQRGRNIRFYTTYAQRKEYMSWGNFLKRGSFINLDYIYSTLSNEGGEDPLDWDAFEKNPMPYKVVASNALTGQPHYFDRSDFSRNHYDPIKASCCVPIVNKPYKIKGVPYYDGGVCDPVPIRKAMADGCDHLVLILTRPEDQYRTAEKDSRQAALFLHRRYPKMADALRNRAHVYNTGLHLAHQLQKEGKLLILAPRDIGGLKTLTIDTEMQMNLYHQGEQEALKLPAFLARINP